MVTHIVFSAMSLDVKACFTGLHQLFRFVVETSRENSSLKPLLLEQLNLVRSRIDEMQRNLNTPDDPYIVGERDPDVMAQPLVDPTDIVQLRPPGPEKPVESDTAVEHAALDSVGVQTGVMDTDACTIGRERGVGHETGPHVGHNLGLRNPVDIVDDSHSEYAVEEEVGCDGEQAAADDAGDGTHDNGRYRDREVVNTAAVNIQDESTRGKKRPFHHIDIPTSAKRSKYHDRYHNIRQIARDAIGRIPGITENEQSMLWHLLFAVGSPEAVKQLKTVCDTARKCSSLPAVGTGWTIRESIQAIEALDTTECTRAILRRYHMAKISSYKEELQARCARAMGPKFAASKALDALVLEALPGYSGQADDDAYQKKRTCIKNYVAHGQNWRLMQKRFSIGILSLIPTEIPALVHLKSEYKIRNSNIERVSSRIFAEFLSIAASSRGENLTKMGEALSEDIFKKIEHRTPDVMFEFETGDVASSFDSPGLVDSCRMVGRLSPVVE